MNRANVVGSLLLCLAAAGLSGCGPTFFSAKGTLSSTGGQLDQWKETPLGCHRDVFDGDTSKLMTFSWGNPNAQDPDRQVHDRTRPAFPVLLSLEKDGAGLKGHLQTSKGGEADLNAGVCKVISLQTKEHSKGFAEMHPTLNGTLTLDCQTAGSHITSDIVFKQCE